MIKFLFTSFLFLGITSVIFTQSDWTKWNAEVIPFKIDNKTTNGESVANKNSGSPIISFLKNTYSFLISDVDGDNCPFYPSCSNFFVQAINEEGLIKGSLMFSDRFLRDLNLFKNSKHYTIHKNGKFYDPPQNYSMRLEKIFYSTNEKF